MSKFLCEYLFSILWGTCLAVELLDYMAVLCVTSGETLKLVSTAVAPFMFPPSVYKVLISSHPCQHCGDFTFF